MSGRLIVRRTLTALSDGSNISNSTLTSAMNIALEDFSNQDFSCDMFGSGLNFGATAVLMDLLFRSNEDPQRFGEILVGNFGNIVCSQAISSMLKGKRTSFARNTDSKKLKTSFSVPRDYWSESDAIRAIAFGILFNSQPGVAVLFPEKIAPVNSTRYKFIRKKPYYLTACSVESFEPNVYIGNIKNQEDVEYLRRICEHNKAQESTETLECVVLPIYENNMIEGLCGKQFPGIGKRCFRVQRRVRSVQNVIYAAFNCAAWRFLQFELGIGKRADISSIKELNEYRDKTDIDKRVMLPMMLRESLQLSSRDSVDSMIIEVAFKFNHGYSLTSLHSEIKDKWDYNGGSRPPSLSDVIRRHIRLALTAKKFFNED
jgi:hypothetical protein